MLMDSDIERMKQAIAAHDARMQDHNDRLVRIETVMEFYRPAPPPPRLRGAEGR
ncbi:hypothetical protein [uncultured Sphingomonas sp.]|uniref:hypothetical protein n=1 Tax=uncultured Sphingomonas sp. TaxID=158754 RepID=UPI0035CAED8B